MSRLYIIYDGRARYDIDKAAVLKTCDTLEEAIEDCKSFASPSPLFSNNPVVYSYDNSGDFLVDRRLEYDPKSKQEDILKTCQVLFGSLKEIMMRTEELTKALFEALDDEVSKCIDRKGELSERSLELLEIAQSRDIGRSAALHWLGKSGSDNG